MKKRLFALASATLFICCSTTFAASAPVPNSRFAVSLTGLYLQPTASNLEYAVYTEPLPLPAPNWSQKSVSTSYQPAFNLGLQYILSDQVDSFSLSWLHVDTNDSSSFSANGTSVSSVAPPYYFGPLAQRLLGSSAKGKANFNVEDVNLAYNHLFKLGRHLQLQPFIAIDTAYLKQYLEDNYQGTTSDSNNNTTGRKYSITSYNTSKFTGIGPQLGLNARGLITAHFSIVAKLAVSVLVGTMKSKTTFDSYDSTAGNTTPTTTSLADQSETQVVPAFNSKLGLSYVIPFKSGSTLGLEAGYLFAIYVNGINQVVPTALVPGAFNNGSIAIETSAQTQSDLGLNVPYLSLSWVF